LEAERPILNHMGIYVRDLPRMEAFYTKALGLLVTDRGVPKLFPGELVFLSAVASRHHQLVLASGRPADANFSVVMQLSFSVKSLQILRDTMQKVRDCGVEDLRTTNHGNSWSCYFKDPEGNMIEVYMDTPFYVAQPFAAPIDLSAPDETILSETEQLCRRDPSFQYREDWEKGMRRRLQENGAFSGRIDN